MVLFYQLVQSLGTFVSKRDYSGLFVFFFPSDVNATSGLSGNRTVTLVVKFPNGNETSRTAECGRLNESVVSIREATVRLPGPDSR